MAIIARHLLSADLRTESQWSLIQAASAIEADGVSGQVMIRFPRKEGGVTEVGFSTGAASVELKYN